MGLGGVEVDTVALVQHECLLAHGQFHGAFEHHIELLTGVRIALARRTLRLGFHGDDEGVCLAPAEAAGRALVVIRLAAFNEGMPSDENGTYFLVINSCKKEHQAQALVKQYAKKGIKAKTIARSGFHHVVVAQSSNQQELIKAKKLLPEKYRKAWVCK